MNFKKTSKVYDYDWNGKKVLVTGASGFKGSWLCAVLLELGAEVYGITRQVLNPMSSYNLLEIDDKIVKVAADISVLHQVFDVLNVVPPDVIFHLAAKAQVPISLRDPRRTFDINIMGTINILEACRQFRIGKRLLIISTDHVFGNNTEETLPKGGFNEKHPVSYSGPYDTSKSAMELCVRSYHDYYIDTLPSIGITRAANVFGYGDVAYRRVIPVFVGSALERKEVPLTCRKNGRQFIYISDIIEGYIRAASVLDDRVKKGPNDFTPTFHFAIEDYGKQDENFIRMQELAEIIASLFNAKVVEEPNCQDYAPNENQIQALNCKDTYQRLKWTPKTRLVDGIEKLREWYLPRRLLDDQIRVFLGDLMKREIKNIVNSLTTTL